MKALLIMTALLVACGQNESRKDAASDVEPATSSAAVALDDDNVATDSVSDLVDDAVESLADESASDSLSLTSDGSDESNKGFTKVCAVDGNAAVVTLTSDFSRSTSLDRPRLSLDRSVVGKGNLARTWTQADKSVACDASNSHAVIDWRNVAGLHLDVKFTRERSLTFARTNKKTGKEIKLSRSFTAEGTRNVNWDSQANSEDGATLVRHKTIVSKVNRSFKAQNKHDEAVELAFTVSTKEDAPLKVSVERDATTLALKSRTIDTGTVIAVKDDDARIETEFTALKMTYGTDQCYAASGSVTTKIYKGTEEQPSKSYTITFDDGTATIKDNISGTESDFTVPECDPEDLR